MAIARFVGNLQIIVHQRALQERQLHVVAAALYLVRWIADRSSGQVGSELRFDQIAANGGLVFLSPLAQPTKVPPDPAKSTNASISPADCSHISSAV